MCARGEGASNFFFKIGMLWCEGDNAEGKLGTKVIRTKRLRINVKRLSKISNFSNGFTLFVSFLHILSHTLNMEWIIGKVG